jgi:6-phosphogluconolactonase
MLRLPAAACLLLFAMLSSLQPLSVQAEESKDSGKLRVYFGTYTGADSRGIYACELDLADGSLSEPRLAGEVKNPSFLALHPGGKHLYAVSEVGGTGAVVAFAIDAKTGGLQELNHQPAGGAGPCHAVVDKEGRNVLVANYGGGSVSAIPIGEDGRLGKPTSMIQHKGSSVNKSRQSEPHAHSINLDAANRFAFAADLGLDKILVYRFDSAKGTLTPNDPPSASVAPGSGPRHFAFHPSGRFAYVINEMASTVTALAYDADKGKLSEIHTLSTLPGKVEGNSTAEVQVHPSGKFVYGSNRGHDSLAIFKVDAGSGRLTAAGHQSTGGKTPRNFGIDPTGRYILAANQGTNNVVVFRVNQETGALTSTGATVKVGAPVCVKFLKL